jgi:hypothetical protein
LSKSDRLYPPRKFNEEKNTKTTLKDVKYTIKDDKLTFSSPGGIIIISEGKLTK